jgi:hypothetical protein
MKDEREPLTDEEYVHRRVLMVDVDENLEMPVAVTGFSPTKDDAGGISVYRAGFVTPEELDQAGRRSGEYYVVRLRVGEIRDREMDVIADPMEPLRGHALIPEIRYGLKGNAKMRLRELRLRLAQLANHHAIVLRPTCGSGPSGLSKAPIR